MAVAVLVDTSSSVSPQDLTRASQFAAALDKARGRHWVRVLPFARSVRDLARTSSAACIWNLPPAKLDAPPISKPAIEEAISSLPSGLVPRIVLVSDGKENAGSITRAAWQAQRLGIPIDTVALAGRPQPHLAPRIGYRAHCRVHRRTVSRGSEHRLAVRGFGLGRDQRRRKAARIESREAREGRQSGSRSRQLTAAGALTLAGVIQAERTGRNTLRSRV